MSALPNVNASLVGDDRCPTQILLGLFPDLSSDAVVVTETGTATPIFRAQLQDAIGGALPFESAILVNPDGTPTRVLVGLLQRLP